MLSVLENWPDAAALPALLATACRCRGEDARVRQRTHARDLVYPLAPGGAGERQARPGPVRLLRPAEISVGNQTVRQPLQHVLLVEHAELVPWWQRVGQRRPPRGRGTGNCPRPSAPSASGLPATRGDTPTAACGSPGTGPARGRPRAEIPQAASPGVRRDVTSIRSACARRPRRDASGRAVERHRGSWPKPGAGRGEVVAEELPAIASCDTGDRCR